jgi:hypothetical protein
VVCQTESNVGNILFKVAKPSRMRNGNTGHFIVRGRVAGPADISRKAHIYSSIYGFLLSCSRVERAALSGAGGVAEALGAAVTLSVPAIRVRPQRAPRHM